MLLLVITSRNLANNILRSFLLKFSLYRPHAPWSHTSPPSFLQTHFFSCLSWEICSRNLIYSVAIWKETETTSQCGLTKPNRYFCNRASLATFFFLWLMSQRTKHSKFCLTYSFTVILHRFWYCNCIAKCARDVRKNSMRPIKFPERIPK